MGGRERGSYLRASPGQGQHSGRLGLHPWGEQLGSEGPSLAIHRGLCCLQLGTGLYRLADLKPYPRAARCQSDHLTRVRLVGAGRQHPQCSSSLDVAPSNGALSG